MGKGLHIGIIPDGSRRWAMNNGIHDYDGTQSGEATEKIVHHIVTNYPEVKEISLWALSTENLKRNERQKDLVFRLIKKKISDTLDYIKTSGNDIKIRAIGSRWSELPKDVEDLARIAVEKTKNNSGTKLNLCIGYGGKDEILDAAMAASRWLRKNPTIAKLHSSIFEKHLMVPKPLDLVIRTGGERRLSGFMLYQIEYAELFFVDALWPDFTTEHFDGIMEKFRSRERRYGK